MSLREDWQRLVVQAKLGTVDQAEKDACFHSLGRLWNQMDSDERREVGVICRNTYH